MLLRVPKGALPDALLVHPVVGRLMAVTLVCAVPGCPNLRPCPTHPQHRGRPHRRASAHVLAATRCAVCGERFTADNPLTRGHVTARSMGGLNVPGNYRAECRRCNQGQRET